MVCESSHNSHVMFLYDMTWLDISDVCVVLGAEDMRGFLFTESKDNNLL